MNDRDAMTNTLPGMHLLKGAVDSHIHCAPHMNERTVTAFDAVRQAAAAGMRGIGILDIFGNTSGLAALAMRELGHLGIDVFGGVILEPYVGGVSVRSVEAALKMGYGPGDGARYISLPCHNTQYIARAEKRSPAFIEGCFAVPANDPIPDPLPEILDLIAAADVVFNTGHLAAYEVVRVIEEARKRGVKRIVSPASYFSVDEARAIADLGAWCEFAFFVMSHATQVGQTMSDKEKHRFGFVTLDSVAKKIQAIGPARTILSSDSGSYVLPPPVEAFREFLIMIQSAGFSDDEVRLMSGPNPAAAFFRDALSQDSAAV